ncbi:hypothetical protein I6N95_15770 [Vagococcus sp. BWB3-3]|uniref:SpaA-like prealbumin fold domain-containing protein n=1 Tax=Vagococcus allomyrinae TaxID=2794353 RepID=A0A940SSX4_9ENTE|nr:SpaA isopeptide-forming pilin-related protein [Vagococcus allomyrinae]MBP1042477.1 hypothetical protein [Vagococcus allomyrinae]
MGQAKTRISKLKGVGLLVVIVVLLTSYLAIFAKNEVKLTAEEINPVTDLYLSEESSDQPLTTMIQPQINQSFTLEVHSFNKEDEQVSLNLPAGLRIEEEKTIAANQSLRDDLASWLRSSEKGITIDMKKAGELIPITKLVLTADLAKDYRLSLSTVRKGTPYQSAEVLLQAKALLTAEGDQLSPERNFQLPSPRVGNQNLDIDLSAVKGTVESGQSAIYELALKVTGASVSYKDVKLIVDLPKTAKFNQNLSELVIAEVVPAYNAADQTLTYLFPELASGQTYKLAVKVTPPNGTTLNNTVLLSKVTLSATGFTTVSDTAEIKVTAATPFTVSTSYIGVKDQDSTIAPRPGDIVVWKVKASVNSQASNLLLLKPASDIVLQDNLQTGLSYSGATSTVTPTVTGSQLSWTFKAPDLVAQQSALAIKGELWSTEFLVYTTISKTIGETATINKTLNMSLTDYSGAVQKQTSNASGIQVTSGSGSLITEEKGDWWSGAYVAPKNGLTNPEVDAVASVTDTAKLWFQYQYVTHGSNAEYYQDSEKTRPYNWSTETAVQNGYKYLALGEQIDPNLELTRVLIIRPRASIKLSIPDVSLPKMPAITLRLEVNQKGNWRELPLDTSRFENKGQFSSYRSEWGLTESDHILSYQLYFDNEDGTPVDGRFATNGSGGLYSIKKGFIGKVTNRMTTTGWIDKQATPYHRFAYLDSPKLTDSQIGPRSTNVVAPTSTKPIARTSVSLKKADGNQVEAGDNRVEAIFYNDSSSPVRITEPLTGMLLLPEGVRLKDDPKSQYHYLNERTALVAEQETTGTNQIVSNDYKGTGRQLIKVTWDRTEIFPSNYVSVGLDVSVAETAVSPLTVSAYFLTGNNQLAVPASTGSVTDSVLEIDSDDIDSDGNQTQHRVVSHNHYLMLRAANVQSEKLVKGDQDTEFSKLGHTSPGGTITYRLKISNTTAEPLTKFTLLDILPSVGDLGITDNSPRESQFTPILTKEIQLPVEWQDKVTVYYSTETNPKRDDLVKNVIYPETTLELKNPLTATEPNWLKAGEVTNWETIHSYKIEMNAGVSWVQGQAITIEFEMKAPEESELADKELMNRKIDEQTRAAWNSFAYAANTLQAVEPQRVGIVINALVGKIPIEKVDANDQKLLQGARFVVAESDEQLKAGHFIKLGASGELVYPDDPEYSADLLNYEVTTDDQGQAEFENLRLDKASGTSYYLQETQAPQGYELRATSVKVTAKLQAEATKIQIENTKKRTLPQTGSMSLILSLLTGIGLVVIGSTRFIISKPKK